MIDAQNLEVPLLQKRTSDEGEGRSGGDQEGTVWKKEGVGRTKASSSRGDRICRRKSRITGTMKRGLKTDRKTRMKNSIRYL